MGEKIDIHSTLFEPYSTIIFDLDGVLWNCFQSSGQATGCYTAVPPLKREAGNIVTSSNGVVIRLQEGVVDLLQALDGANKNLGIVSKSEAPGATFAAQPAVMLLKQYGMYGYFNYDIILKWGMNKAQYVKPNGKTLFIDDEQQNLEGVNQKDQVDVLWRKAFGDWRQTLSPVQSHLNFSFMLLEPSIEASLQLTRG
jgi:predicted phosphatase